MTRSELRVAMPGTVANIDEFRKWFPEAQVTYSLENGMEWGKRGPEGVRASESKPFVHLTVAKSKRQRKSEAL